tara:strand:- start:174 stop:314 length:141 start_codon:yes stop_codon:yes gene_type:complete
MFDGEATASCERKSSAIGFGFTHLFIVQIILNKFLLGVYADIMKKR